MPYCWLLCLNPTQKQLDHSVSAFLTLLKNTLVVWRVFGNRLPPTSLLKLSVAVCLIRLAIRQNWKMFAGNLWTIIEKIKISSLSWNISYNLTVNCHSSTFTFSPHVDFYWIIMVICYIDSLCRVISE